MGGPMTTESGAREARPPSPRPQESVERITLTDDWHVMQTLDEVVTSARRKIDQICGVPTRVVTPRKPNECE